MSFGKLHRLQQALFFCSRSFVIGVVMLGASWWLRKTRPVDPSCRAESKRGVLGKSGQGEGDIQYMYFPHYVSMD